MFGLPCGDVNIDYGLTGVLARPAPPRIHCFGANWDRTAALCKKVRPEVARRSRELVTVRALLLTPFNSPHSYGCRQPNGKPGPNHAARFCTPLFAIEGADVAYLKATVY